MTARVRVLLTEGSSLTSREVVSCLGPAGYHIEILDPSAMCLARFSRWVRRVHRCPHAAEEPLAYVEQLGRVVAEREIDVVLPTHEQAWLLSAARPLLVTAARFAVAEASAFERVQSKIEFARLLDDLGLPQPQWRTVATPSDLDDLAFPYWLKSAFSTAGQGVREVVDPPSRDAALAALFAQAPLMAQRPAAGQYGQVQGLFDHGQAVALHTSVQRGTGMGGSAAARMSVDHRAPREHIAALGEALAWHGGLTLDYFHENGRPCYIECNPRTVEPGNAAASGVNIPDLQIRLSLGVELPSVSNAVRAGVRTHGAIALLLGSAGEGASRRRLLREVLDALRHRGLCEDSREQLTPILGDPPSLVPAVFLVTSLLLAPGSAPDIAARAISSYSIGPATIEEVVRAAARQSDGLMAHGRA